MSAAARDLAVHLSRQVLNSPNLAYLIGPGSRTWELLIEAIAGITGETAQVADDRLRRSLAEAQAGRLCLPRIAHDGWQLAQWIDFHWPDQDMNHTDFRAEAGIMASAIIRKANGE